ncbi:uncharacterized protein N7482_005366 [Penicillium canariense]|uniref:FAD/NAD(P)-binding domain-containing protein n=1 Tax=Penicillium canariense TaxID=189055 RepID=A0A9W9LN51_9EURO|nr:uncharacterized protein N7482_005366 [Penicillium canariense]KAJ5166585.1 hypothetical protein N7482_005366 [Penicillium canariense]
MASRKCAAVVVGAGPGGVAVVGNLLERQLGTITWVDPSFEAGRVNRKYREVPSNTKVALFQAYATAVQPFKTVIDNTPTPNAFSTMAKLDQEKTCHLHYAADMIRGLTDGLMKMDQVHACRGFVTAASLSEKVNTHPTQRTPRRSDPKASLPRATGSIHLRVARRKANNDTIARTQASNGESQWTVRIKQHGSPDELEIQTARLILCTGSHPTNIPVPVPGLTITSLDLDTVLKPSELATILPPTTPSTVAVVGASHSAILALLNLVTLARTSHPHLRVKWFTRHPLRYAEYMDGWILRDNTGLKGSAADFARTQLEDDQLATSDAGEIITKINCGGGEAREAAQYRAHLPSCSHIVQAVGFTRDPLPQLTRGGAPLTMEFDHSSGCFHERGGGPVIPGLFGAGIAFPEQVVDPRGNVEYAVGFFKFMKFLKRVVPSWTAA